MAAEFKIQRGTSVIASSGTTVTITAGTEYTAPASLTKAFIRITNCGLTASGRTSGGAGQDINLYTVSISNPANLLTSITFTRFGSPAQNSRVHWEIIEYIGAASGPNEFIVRAQAQLTGTGNTLTGSTITTIADNTDVVVFITGQRGNIANRSLAHQWKRVSSLVANASDWDPTFVKGGGTSNTAVSYAVVEFTGSNWSVARESFTTEASVWASGDDVSSTVAFTTSLAAVSRTFLHVQYTADSSGVVEDCADAVGVDSTTNMRLYNHAIAGVRTKVVWVIENSDDVAASEMIVEHVAILTGNGGDTINQTEEYVYSVSASAVRALDETSVMGESVSHGNTAAQDPYCAQGVEVAGTAGSPIVQFTECESNSPRRIRACLVQWPRSAVPTTAPGTLRGGDQLRAA
jgi:hypothetical protein